MTLSPQSLHQACFIYVCVYVCVHYGDVIMGVIASQITSLTIAYSTVYSDADQRKHQSSASLAFVRGIHRGPVNSAHKWPVTRKMFPFDDVIMVMSIIANFWCWGWLLMADTLFRSVISSHSTHCKQFFVFQLPVPSGCWETLEIYTYIYIPWLKFSKWGLVVSP